MEVQRHIETAWRLTTGHLLPFLWITLCLLALGTLTLGLLAPALFAGYTQSALLVVRSNRRPRVRDLFSQMHLFFPLLGFSVAAAIAVVLGSLLLVVPGIIVAVGILLCCLYMVPLMTDQRQSLWGAVQASYHLAASGPFLEHLLVSVLYLAILAAGSSLPILILFAQPFATVFLTSLYEEKQRLPRP